MQKVTIQSNSVLAIFDKTLRDSRLQPEYSMQDFIDMKSEKIESGLILSNVKGAKIDFLNKFTPDNLHKLGILGFVNGEEPGNGKVPLHKVVPKVNDIISLAYIEEGKYRGNFKKVLEGKQIEGVQKIMSHQVTAEDLQNSTHMQVLAKK